MKQVLTSCSRMLFLAEALSNFCVTVCRMEADAAASAFSFSTSFWRSPFMVSRALLCSVSYRMDMLVLVPVGMPYKAQHCPYLKIFIADKGC